MPEELTRDQAEDWNKLLAEVAYGAKLRKLIGAPGDYQFETIMSNRDDIIRMLNALRIFGDSGLDIYGVADAKKDAETGAIIARYTEKGRQVYVFLTTDAKSEIVSSILKSLPEELQKVEKEFIFFGYQDPELSKAEMNGRKLESCSKAGITLPNRYRQVYDLIVAVSQAYGVTLPPSEVRTLFENYPARSNSLLVGNGLNLLTNPNMGWTRILKQLATSFIAPAEQAPAISFVEDSAIPSPIKFEYLADHSANRLGGTNIFGQLKDGIAAIVSGSAAGNNANISDHGDESIPSDSSGSIAGINLPPDDIKDLLTNTDIESLLTTNYDLVLEQCFRSRIRSITETKYILNATSRPDYTPSIYHVHGIAGVGRNSTICIGYEHYMGYIQKLRARLIRNNRRRESSLPTVFLLLGVVPPSSTWEELFFTTNMSIVGLGLTFEETDLWELLVLRAAVLNTSNTLRSAGLPEKNCSNTITYYAIEVPDDATKDNDKTKGYVEQAGRIRKLDAPVMDQEYWLPVAENKAKERALKGLNVEVRVVHTTDYAEGYRVILRALPSKG